MNQMTRARVSKTEDKREHGNLVEEADELYVEDIDDDCDINEHTFAQQNEDDSKD